jgi:hypothetical protein
MHHAIPRLVLKIPTGELPDYLYDHSQRIKGNGNQEKTTWTSAIFYAIITNDNQYDTLINSRCRHQVFAAGDAYSSPSMPSGMLDVIRYPVRTPRVRPGFPELSGVDILW